MEVGRDIPLIQINIDLGESIHDLLLAVDIGVEKTKNELEV